MDRRNWMKTAGLAGAGMLLSPGQILRAMQANELRAADFGPDFAWGVATAAYQIEGAWNVDGKGESIWDRFSHTKGKIEGNENGDVACDFYHSYPEDLAIMSSLNIPNNRFSLSWTRILPKGTGAVNQKGIDFYHKVIDRTLELGMEPWLTIYHWDLPQKLEDEGGWTNRKTLDAFREYADLVTRTYGDKVKKWMVLNEPMAFVGVGYFLGLHAPGRKGVGNFMPAIHHAALAQAEGGRIVRANVSGADVGSTFSASHIDPKKATRDHKRAAARVDALLNRLFLEPCLGLGYPFEDMGFFAKKIEKKMLPGDADLLKFDFDFIGLQNYTREVVKKAIFPPIVWAKQIKAEKRNVPLTEMGWEVYPEGIYHLLKKFDAYEGIDRIIVTENGAAFPDSVENGSVHDPRRIQFFKDYLSQVLRAQKEGVNVDGYFVWTFMDNFEWAEGYRTRFGLVHVDFETQKRTIKDSGLWFRDFLLGK